MASNEAIQNLATLLGALKDYNQPRREMEQYAAKALIDFNMKKNLIELERDKEYGETSKINQIAAAQASIGGDDYVPYSEVKEDIESVTTSLQSGVLGKMRSGAKPKDYTSLDYVQLLPVGSEIMTKRIATKKIGEILENQRTLVTLLGDAISTGKGIDTAEDNLEKIQDYKNSLIKISGMSGYGSLTEEQQRLSTNLFASLNTYENIITGK